MADLWGHLDNRYSGGSDVWDAGLVGEILLQDYFIIVDIPDVGRVKIYRMGEFVSTNVFWWDATNSVWQPAVVRYWDGSAWV